jgi:lipoprotein-anchoring transpeptidase ErfK/SrfK
VKSRILSVALAPLALALAAPAASAQLPVTNTTPPPPTAADANLSVTLVSGITDRKRRFVLQGGKLLVRGTIKPFVEGQTVSVDVFRGGKLVVQRSATVTKGKGGAGQFSVLLGGRKPGVYFVRAHHDATAEQKAGTSARQRFNAIAAKVRGRQAVRLLQIALRRLGYVTPLSGSRDAGTSRAVLAFRKVNRYSRNGYASPGIFRKLFNGSGTYHLRYPKAGTHVEADLSRQVLVLASKGRAVQIYAVSSGKPSTPTIQGKFKFYRRQPGTNSHGMVESTYFHGGYAIHGYASVPATYPASHGCIRVPIPDAFRIYHSIRLGETIYVYH